MDWIAPWVWHPVVMFVFVQLGWTLLRRYLGKHPVVWLTQRLHLKERHPRRNADVLRWAIILVVTLLLWGAVDLISLGLAALGPHEGDAAESAVTINAEQFVPRNKETGAEAGTNLYLTANRSIIICSGGYMQMPNQAIPAATQKEDFRVIVGELDLENATACQRKDAGSRFVITIRPQDGLSDDKVDEWKAGKRPLYMMAAWKFSLPGNDDKFYIQEFCGFLPSTTGFIGFCDGPHNQTYRHLVKS
jgi:hypothetical protein